MRKITCKFVAVLLCSSIGFAVAADAEPLTAEKVQRFVRSVDDVYAMAKKYEDRLIDMGSTSRGGKADPGQAFGDAVSAMQAHPAYQEFLGIVRRHGFTGTEDWTLIGTRVMITFAALVTDEQKPALDKQLAEAMAQIDQANLSAEQKAAMRQMMATAGQNLATLHGDVSEADKAAVRPSIAAIKAWEKLD